MTSPLDSSSTYAVYDPQDSGYGIERLSEQVRLAWHDAQEVGLPSSYRLAEQIVVVGMGGSSLGAHLIEGVLATKSKKPLFIIRDYQLPVWVTSKTLVILSSFSGTTEEVLAAAEDAKQRHAKIIVIATGGTLASWAKRNGYPAYIFTPGDLAKQPRLGLGFSFAGMLGLLTQAGLCKMKDEDMQRAISAMAEVTDLCAVDIPTAENPAKQVAEALAGRQIYVVAAEHLSGNAHVLANQLNETAKQWTTYGLLPEIDHHLLEGLSHPKELIANTTVLFLTSSLYHPRNRKRCTVTADIVEKTGVQVVDYHARGKDALEEMCEVLQFSSYVSWYTAMLHKENPILIPYVDMLKKAMGK